MTRILEKPALAAALSALLALGVMFAYHRAYLTDAAYLGPFLTFLHVLSAITWVGLLYYFNLIQIPLMPLIPAEMKPAIGKFVAPKALFWFRWSALATVVTGLAVLFTGTAAVNHTLMTGMTLGLIMAFNVWFIIWPAQKKALGIVPAEDAVKAKAGRRAMLASRINFVLSLPMLYCMVTARLVG